MVFEEFGEDVLGREGECILWRFFPSVEACRGGGAFGTPMAAVPYKTKQETSLDERSIQNPDSMPNFSFAHAVVHIHIRLKIQQA